VRPIVYNLANYDLLNNTLPIGLLHPGVTKAIHIDQNLYKLLALTDVIRIGKVRECKVAIDELKKWSYMSHYENIKQIKAVYNAWGSFI
jgi:hypothetical protein